MQVCQHEQIRTKRFTVVNASSRQSTFSKIEQHKLDLSGIEILKKIKADFPKICIIMVSGQSTIANVKESLTNGAAGFIVKPFSGDKVLEALKNFEKRMK